jgi:hypothetical protein
MYNPGIGFLGWQVILKDAKSVCGKYSDLSDELYLND